MCISSNHCSSSGMSSIRSEVICAVVMATSNIQIAGGYTPTPAIVSIRSRNERNYRRKARIVRNHIGCAILVWVRLKQVAHETGRTIYQVKHGLLSDYLRQQLKSPTVKMTLA